MIFNLQLYTLDVMFIMKLVGCFFQMVWWNKRTYKINYDVQLNENKVWSNSQSMNSLTCFKSANCALSKKKNNIVIDVS